MKVFGKCLNVSILVLALCYAFPALADNCDNLDDNPRWESNLEQFNAAYSKGEWNAALGYSKELESVCDKSPMLNYSIAQIHKNLGSQEKYLFYLQKSTQNTDKFVVDKDVLDQIWSEKYIAANPGADPETIKEREATIVKQSDQIASLQQELSGVKLTAGEAIGLQEEVNTVHTIEDVMLWTGVGVGAAGLILTGVGTAFVIKNKDSSVIVDGESLKTRSEYPMGWGLVSAGVGVTVIGAALAGFFGYRYAKNHKNDNKNELSMSITPSYASIIMSF